MNDQQLRQAFETLLDLSQVAQTMFYDEWLHLSKGDVPAVNLERINRVEKIDLSNNEQFIELKKYFSFNVNTINFWLNRRVFPVDMQHRQKRLSANSWHLAQGGVIGFSGTNDNYRNLPLLVTQHFPNLKAEGAPKWHYQVWRDMLSTNGMMLQIIISETIECEELPNGPAIDSILARLSDPTKPQCQVIIDAGALLAGNDNFDVASKLLNKVHFPAVAFPDTHDGSWHILDKLGRVLPIDQSPIPQDNCFVFFDEPRCRGSDRKLASTAIALLTVGPALCKDKLLQSAGRMRALGRSQSLVVTGQHDVWAEIENCCGAHVVDIKAILSWTISNTGLANAKGLVESTDQGLFYCTTKSNPKNCVEDEKCELHERFAGAMKERINNDDYKIIARVTKFGAVVVQASSGMEEECEREVELEKEREEEQETQFAEMKPYSETDWDVGKALTTPPSFLPFAAGVTSLADFVKKHLKIEPISRIRWSGKIYGTKNFFTSVLNDSGNAPIPCNSYLRVVDTCICYGDGLVLLVSEREADELIDLCSRPNGNVTDTQVVHLTFARLATDRQINGHSVQGVNGPLLVLKGSGGPLEAGSLLLNSSVLTEIQVFPGETTYGNRKEELKALLRPQREGEPNASAEPEKFVELRGKHRTFKCSDLEKICKQVAQNR